jgi:hypothetical protein
MKMKKWLIILLFILPGFAAFAQDDDGNQEGGKVPERMRQYIQDRLGLTKKESEKFSPVFLRYFREFARTHREFKGDNLIFKQKIIELRIRYRSEFKQIMDEQRANKVYIYEDEFRRKAVDIIRENKRDRPFIRRNRSLLQ